jgi:oxygen-dependent protoporphyrinogen oxidase
MNSVAVIGAGITGLTAAFKLRQKGIPVRVYEAGGRVGGVIQTVRQDGFLAECGPNSILETSPRISGLVTELGLDSRRIYSDANAEKRYLVRRGRLVELPISPLRMLTTGLFSWRAKLRLLAEPFISRAPEWAEENLADFVVRRLGREFLDYAINPFVAGVYAGAPSKLSVKHAFPRLHALEQRYGSLILGQFLGARERKRRGEVSKQSAKKLSFDDGLGVLTGALHSRLGGTVRLHTPIQRIAWAASGWRLFDKEGDEIPAKHSAVLLTAPAHQLAKIEIDNASRHLLCPLGAIPYPPVTSLALGFRREDVAHPLDGFGMLIPEVEGFHLLGTLFISSLFPGRAPAREVLLTSYLGGARAPQLVLASESQQIELALEDLQKLLGVRGRPTFVHRWTFPKAIPQYEVGFGRFKRMMNELETDHPGLFLAGNFRDGISLGDSIIAGGNAADRLTEFLRPKRTRERPAFEAALR